MVLTFNKQSLVFGMLTENGGPRDAPNGAVYAAGVFGSPAPQGDGSMTVTSNEEEGLLPSDPYSSASLAINGKLTDE